MFNIFIILKLIGIQSTCVTPNLKGNVIENDIYFSDPLIAGEILEELTEISYDCKGEPRQSSCIDDKWVPHLSVEECKSVCVIQNVTGITYVGNYIGDEIPEGKTVGFVCTEEDHRSLATSESTGISICYKNNFSPPIKCVPAENLCEIPGSSAVGIREFLDGYKYANFIENNKTLRYLCEENFTPVTQLENKTNVGNFQCIGEFPLTKNPQCLRRCEISSITDKNAQIIIQTNFVKSGHFLSYSCPESHPVSLDDINNTNNVRYQTGIGKLECNDGIFEPEKLCFTGCIMPPDISEKRHLQNNEDSFYKCPESERVPVSCRNNQLSSVPVCNSIQKCTITVDNIPLAGIVENKLNDHYSAIYKCPKSHPLSRNDVQNVSSGNRALGYGITTCHRKEIECSQGCFIPENIIYDLQYLLKNQHIENFGCPPGKFPNTNRSTCTGSVFEPRIVCQDNLLADQAKDFCEIPKLNVQLDFNSVEVGSKLNINCKSIQYELICERDGFFSPRIPTDCLKICSENSIRNIFKYSCLGDNIGSVSHALEDGISICHEGVLIPEYICEPSDHFCKKPYIPNSQIYYKTQFNGVWKNDETLRYTCNYGYVLSNNYFDNFLEITCNFGIVNIDKDILFECKPKCRVKKQFESNFSKTLLNLNDLLNLKCVEHSNLVDGICSNENFDFSEQLTCKKYCTFLPTVTTVPEFVYLKTYYIYKCRNDYVPTLPFLKIEGENIFAVNYCFEEEFIFNLDDYCAPREFCYTNAKDIDFTYFAHPIEENVDVYCESKIETIQCTLNSWVPSLNNIDCIPLCKIIPIQSFEIVFPPENSYVGRGVSVKYRCNSETHPFSQNDSDINSDTLGLIEVICTENFQFETEFNYLKYFCKGGCDILTDMENFTLLSDYKRSKFPAGSELRYKCNNNSREINVYCTHNVEIQMDSCVYCQIPSSISNGNINSTLYRNVDHINFHQSFQYNCNEKYSKPLIQSVCTKKGSNIELFPKPICCCNLNFPNACFTCEIMYLIISVLCAVPVIGLIVFIFIRYRCK